MDKHLTIAIDGPAGAGKSTIAKKLAAHYGIIYVDTGAMYRAVALYMMNNKVDLNKEEDVKACLDGATVSLTYHQGNQIVLLNSKDVTESIRRQEVGENASKVSLYLPVRRRMVELQQAMAEKSSLVMDGRDIGTHVLVNATIKIFLTADVMIRAKRRYDQLLEKGEKPDLDIIASEIRDRDYRDMNREHSPLRQAEDAVVLNTSDMSVDQVANAIIQLVERR